MFRNSSTAHTCSFVFISSEPGAPAPKLPASALGITAPIMGGTLSPRFCFLVGVGPAPQKTNFIQQGQLSRLFTTSLKRELRGY